MIKPSHPFYKGAFAMNNEETNALFQQSMAFYQEKKYEDALRITQQLEQLLPQNKDVLFQKALCLAALRRFDQALGYCKNLENQFEDSRVRDLQVWIAQNSQTFHKQRFTDIKQEAGAIDTEGPTEREIKIDLVESQAEKQSIPGEGMIFCPKCGSENDKNNYRCGRCGEILHQKDQPVTPFHPGATPDIEKLEKRANISFITALLGWLCGLVILAMGSLINPQNESVEPILGLIVLLLFGLAIILCIVSVVFGILGMKRANTKNRWKAIAGIIIGGLGLASMVCCFLFVMTVVVALVGGEVPLPTQ